MQSRKQPLVTLTFGPTVFNLPVINRTGYGPLAHSDVKETTHLVTKALAKLTTTTKTSLLYPFLLLNYIENLESN